MTSGAKAVADAFVAACEAELGVVKPGNVHRFAPGHGMDAALFVASARASAPFIAAPGMPVGERILKATRGQLAGGRHEHQSRHRPSRSAAGGGGRTPRRQRSPTAGPAALKEAVTAVLADLTADDARDAFAAIARASPGGLGDHESHDVRAAPTISLVEAMRLAADRDLVARQYCDGFEEIFAIGLPALERAAATGGESREGLGPALDCYLAFAASFADSHILRKYGSEQAETVRRRFAEFSKRLSAMDDSREALAFALAFDGELKRSGLNPGTSADLTVASLFAKSLAELNTG